MLGRMGATYIAAVGGILTALRRTSMAPFTLIFAVSYGVLVDSFFFILKIKTAEGNVKTSRLVASMTLSTALLGIVSYYTTVHLAELLPKIPMLELLILAMGTVNGMVAGYLASIIWRARFSFQSRE